MGEESREDYLCLFVMVWANVNKNKPIMLNAYDLSDQTQEQVITVNNGQKIQFSSG